MASKREIVVTGVGVVSPIGIGKDPFWAGLCAGQSGIRRLATFEGCSPFAAIGGEVVDFDAKQYVRPRKSLKVMSRDIQLAFAAADLACADAGLRERPLEPERLGVIFGAALIPGELDELVGAYRSCLADGDFAFDRWGPSAMTELFPLWMLKYLPNMPACHIGIGQDARGPNNTITMGDVSSLSALIEAARVVDRGQADAVIAGGVGVELHPVIWARGEAGQVWQRDGDPAAASRPFDAGRDGVVNAEGAAAVIVEPLAHAQARGATVFARLLGSATAFAPISLQPCRATISDKRGDAIGRAIEGAIRDAGLTPAEVGCVVAHGKSTVEDDRLEAQAIRRVLGDVPVTAPKGNFGYARAASGALETAAAVLACQHNLIPHTLNYEHPDPQCPINVVCGQPRPLDRPTTLVLSHSLHGQAVAVILAAAENIIV